MMITTKTRAADALDEILAAINNIGVTAGSLRLFTGSAPANLATGATGTQLANCVIGDISTGGFDPTDTTTLIAQGHNGTNPYWAQDTSPAASGTIGYWRIFDSSGAATHQGSVGLASSGADIEFNTLTVTAGVLVQITTMAVEISGIV